VLTGDAKRAYQREYMRKKRAGEPTTKPKEWQPTYNAVSEIEHWVKYQRSWRIKPAQRDVVEGLVLTLPECPEYDGDDLKGSIEHWKQHYPAHEQAVLDHVRTDPPMDRPHLRNLH
jgi:hypothetical protein